MLGLLALVLWGLGPDVVRDWRIGGDAVPDVQPARGGSDARRSFASLSGERLTPVIVEIERKNLVPPRGRLWVYLSDDGGRPGRAGAIIEGYARVSHVRSEVAVAIRCERGGTPMLLVSSPHST